MPRFVTLASTVAVFASVVVASLLGVACAGRQGRGVEVGAERDAGRSSAAAPREPGLRGLDTIPERLRSRAQSLSELCAVMLSDSDDGPPEIGCDARQGLGGAHARDVRRRVRAEETSPSFLADTAVDVRGSFTAPGRDERLVVFWGGPTNGAGGARTAYVFTFEGAWRLTRTLTSFPATRCVPALRPGRSSLLVCSMFSTWMSTPSSRLALFDLGRPLEEDVFAKGGEAGWLAPVTTFLESDVEAWARLYTCPDDVFAMTITPEILELSGPRDSASGRMAVAVVAPVSSRADVLRLCAKAGLDVRQDRDRLWKLAAAEVGPPTRFSFSLAPTGDGLALEGAEDALRRLAALGLSQRPSAVR